MDIVSDLPEMCLYYQFAFSCLSMLILMNILTLINPTKVEKKT
jgi:hypothetical protein